MYPEIIESIEIDGLVFCALSNGCIVTGIELQVVDTELSDLSAIEGQFSEFLKSLSTDVLMRVWLSSNASFDGSTAQSRSEAVSELGHVENRMKLFFELGAVSTKNFLSSLFRPVSRATSLENRAQSLKASFDLNGLSNSGLRFRSLRTHEIDDLLVKSNSPPPSKLPYGVDLGSQVVGVVRLVRQTSNMINVKSLALLKDSLPLPYEIRVSVRRLSSERSEVLLRKKTGQVSQGTDKISAQKYLDAQDQLEDVALFGGSLLETEVLVLLSREDEKEIRRDSDIAIQRLKPIGDWAFETFGAAPSFLSAQIGIDQHVPLLETDRALPSLLPIWTEGSSTGFSPAAKPRSLTVHRRDQSLCSVDLFDSNYDNYSACIFGRSGRGKSVLTNLLTRALHFDPNVQIIKIDVGGSHSKETNLLGGEERSLSLTEPSGINPFSVLREREHSDDVCNVLSGFLNVLLLEEGESILSKSMRGEIESAISRYSISRPMHPSIEDFYRFATELPRRELLARWTSKGIYKNAFREIQSETGRSNSSKRLRYFNFSQIFQANDPDFGQGGLAAVMAQFNLDLMFSKGKKLVFIADETPFFIERCFSFFKFSTANVRKFGGSFITIAQKSTDVIVNADTGIIENSAQKFLFSIDGDPEVFARRLKINNETIREIEALKSQKGVFSEVLFQDAYGSRVLRIQLSKDEYWRVTSSQDDNERIKLLMANIPGLTMAQAVRALSGAGA